MHWHDNPKLLKVLFHDSLAVLFDSLISKSSLCGRHILLCIFQAKSLTVVDVSAHQVVCLVPVIEPFYRWVEGKS